MADPIVLNHLSIIELNPGAPFNFDATLHKPDHFPSTDNLWRPGVRWQTMLWQGRQLGLKVEALDQAGQPRLRLSVYSAEALDAPFLAGLEREIRYRYNLDLDLDRFYAAFEQHPLLGPVIQRWRGLRPINFGSLYEYLVIAIVLQNAPVRRSVNMLETLFQTYGARLAYDRQCLSCFWEPPILGQTSEEALRALKVGYRAKSFLRVTEAFTGQAIDEFTLRQQPLETQRQALLGLYGVGPASVGYILFDVFHQLDDFQHISPWEQKIYSRLFFGLDPENPAPVPALLDYFNTQFAGYRALAVHYLWEDLFWRRKHEPVEWLEKLIRL